MRTPRFFGTTGLDKIIGPAFVGLAVAEAAKHGLINPVLEMTGIKKPSYVPPPAMSQYEEIMLGQQQQPGFLGFGGQQRTQGLIEKRALFDMDQQRNRQVMSDRIARMQIQNNSPLEMTRVLAERDRYSANQNALASMSGAMANSMTGNIANPNQIGYSQTGYAQAAPMNYDAATYATGRMRRGRGGGRYGGVDMQSGMPPGAPMTPDLQDRMQYSSAQMGQFSGDRGAIARGYDSAKYGYVDNMVPNGVENYALGYGPAGGRRRGRG